MGLVIQITNRPSNYTSAYVSKLCNCRSLLIHRPHPMRPFRSPSTSPWTVAATIRRGTRRRRCIGIVRGGLRGRLRCSFFGRVVYEMRESAWRPSASGEFPRWMAGWMHPFARPIDAAKKHVVSSTLKKVDWNAELLLDGGRGGRWHLTQSRGDAESWRWGELVMIPTWAGRWGSVWSWGTTDGDGAAGQRRRSWLERALQKARACDTRSCSSFCLCWECPLLGWRQTRPSAQVLGRWCTCRTLRIM